ncbi:hypothetical protein RI129_006685 [Pyrocoelia pectoralis]|uniref:Uncharacterized protein n=1 Tax=Pyrocoelia pectoralis TaxID=417401 RepID=A0AAN7VB73_9COLE
MCSASYHSNFRARTISFEVIIGPSPLLLSIFFKTATIFCFKKPSLFHPSSIKGESARALRSSNAPTISTMTKNECIGKVYRNVTLAAYFPANLEDEDDSFRDIKGKRLRSLQDYLDNRSEFVTLAMDEKLGLPYGTNVCIPELNTYFKRYLKFQVRDSGTDLMGMGYKRADIFVRTEVDSYDTVVNSKATLVFVK